MLLVLCSKISQGHAPQPVQQEASSSDSDICSECSTLDSDISDNREVGTSKSAAANGTTAHTDSFARRQPTLVQHAAAATIQRRFRQQLHTRRQGCTRNMQPRPDQNQISINSTVKTLAEAHTQQQHEAASCIQAWWRRQCAIRRVQMAAPPTPPCSNMQTGCNSMHSSRPDSASSISQSGEHETADCTVQACLKWRNITGTDPKFGTLMLQHTCSSSMDRFKPAAVEQCQIMCCRAGCTYFRRGVCYKPGRTSLSWFRILGKAACEQHCTAKEGACTASLLPSSKYSSNACGAAHN